MKRISNWPLIKILSVLFFMFSITIGAQVLAQTTPDSNEDVWRQQSIAEFEQWRQSIPDYEKRLYERVKKINHRTVRLTNVVIGATVLILLVTIIGFSRLLTRKKIMGTYRKDAYGSDKSASESFYSAPHAIMTEDMTKNAGVEFAPQDTTEELAKLHHQEQQHRDLESGQTQLKMFFTESASRTAELSAILDKIKSSIDDLDKEAKEDPKQIAKQFKKIRRTQEDLEIYLSEIRNFTKGLSRLVENAGSKIDSVGKQFESL